MDKENGKGNEGNSGSSKVSNSTQDAAVSLLDAASLFGAYWPRGEAANLFAAGGGFALPPHPGMPFGMLPPGAASGRSYASTATSSAAYNAAAYTNTLSVAASQAASLGIPAASAAWWSMASHLAAQDYLARLQASGLNFPGLGNPADPYSALGLPSISTHHKSKNSKGSSSSRSQHNSKQSSDSIKSGSQNSSSTSARLSSSSSTITSSCHLPSQTSLKYSTGLTIKPAMKLPPSGEKQHRGQKGGSSNCDYLPSGKQKAVNTGNSNVTSTESGSPSPSIFSSPLSLASNNGGSAEKGNGQSGGGAAGLPASILRLPPDTEIIKYTSSIVGPKIPGTTNRGRKKTISLDPPSVSVHPSHSSTGLLIERTTKRPKLTEHELSPPSTPSGDRVEVIKLPATNGTPSYNSASDSCGEAPLNLSLKPSTSSCSTSSLTSLSNMSASIGTDRISRRKPGPKPRRVIPSSTTPSPSSSHGAPATAPPGAPSASLNQLFAQADSPRPPSRNEGSDGGSSTSSTCASSCTIAGGSTTISPVGQKEGRPRNLGRGVSKPKKNTVASLLAQSRALGIKPMPMLDPSISMNQQMNLLKSNILAAQQYIQEVGGDEKTLNKFLQDRLRGTLSDSKMEVEVAAKKQKQYDERLLRVPLEKGWRRETIIRGLTKNGGIKGDVTYVAPESSNKFKQMSDVTQYLEYQKSIELSKDNFTFSSRVIIGDYLQPVPLEMQADGLEFIHLSEEDVLRRLDELKSSMRTSLPVEQRIEMARKQQAARAAARLDREQARLTKELERSERQEQARREKEARSQQMLEAKRKRQEEMERHKQEEQQRKQQERELKRQQAALLKEQEKERRRQHMALVKSLESRRKLEERERKKQQLLAEKQANKEKKLEQRRQELEILAEIRKPCEDLELEQRELPEYTRVSGLRLPGKAFGEALMVFEFLHTFGETLGFDMDSLPTLDSLQQALMPNEHTLDAEEELFSVMTHLLVCAIEDPGIPNPARYTTILGQSLRTADITHANLSEILRIYLYANATGEVKALTGVHFERDREKRVADHHQNEDEMQVTQIGKNSQYYEQLHNNRTYKLSGLLKDKPFMALSPSDKAEMLAYVCNELLQNKAVIRQVESSLETVAQQKKEKWLLDMKIRKLKMLHNRKLRAEAVERAQTKIDGEDSNVDSPSLHKDDLLDDDENDISENESVGTQPEEEEDIKLSCEELSKKLEKLIRQSDAHLNSLNTATCQLRATCFGQDRFHRRYWSFPKTGGLWIEAMESADPDELEEQTRLDNLEISNKGIKCLNDLNNILDKVERINDATVDKEVSSIVDRIDRAVDDDDDNEHRKTPNRSTVFENGEAVLDKNERNLAELKKSVDDIVQNLERNLEMEKQQQKKEEEREEDGSQVNANHVKTEEEASTEPFGSKKFNLFERLGQCMERENKTEEDLKAEVKAEVKEELKNEILNELKSEIKAELKNPGDESEQKWFSILDRDGVTCDGIHLTSGQNGIGSCGRDITELKIPVFPPPNSNYHHNCDSPAPLQMTHEESVQLEHIKKHGMQPPLERRLVPSDKQYGWWRILDTSQLREVLDNLHVRGVRERELKRSFINVMQTMYEGQGRLVIEEGNKELTELNGDVLDQVTFVHGEAPAPDVPGAWNANIAHRVDLSLLEQVEALEDKVANASMQVKGWKIPNRDPQDVAYRQVVPLVKERLASLEQNIERRYLKPPLGVNTGDPNLAAIAQEAASGCSSSTASTSSTAASASPCASASTASATAPSQPTPGLDDVPKGLATWREAINRCQTSAQLAMCLYQLESSIAWDKSIMKANCQFCHSGDNEDKLLLCDGCDKGYHTYCFKPKMENIPDGDWYCHECMNKATGERNCIVCGKKVSTSGTKLILCDLCPRCYHTDCLQPALGKVPRGKWYCSNCITKKPQKRPVRKNHNNKVARDSESSDHPPSSPAPSHSSATTNEDVPSSVNCTQSDVSNSSLANVGSPSTPQAVAAAAAAFAKKENKTNKKLLRELAPCKTLLEDLECHDDAWPFLLPVNTKQFPTYKKIIKVPMDLSTIKKKLQDVHYKSKEEFCADVRQIFNNCETFNEDDSPVGKAGHCMRQFFEARWNEICSSHS